jgi:NAD(P)-dependent dehydrogenase (short-subunit alcohol dehydrogenase family)
VSDGGRADLIGVDLSDYDDVRRAATDLLAVADRIDVLINNAGVFRSTRQVTAAGHEATMAVNHLGGFLLTQLLRERLVESGARVVFVSSDAHWQAAPPDPTDLAGTGSWKDRDHDANAGFAAYNTAKLWVTACAVELAERWDGTGVTVNVLTPGALVPTGIYADLDGWMGRIVRGLRPILRDPDKAVRNYLYVATSPEVEGVTGWYFKDQRPIAPSLLAQDPELRRQLWAASCDAVGMVASAPHA